MLDKRRPIIVIGFGSIGKRHYRNLQRLGCTALAVYDPKDKAFQGHRQVRRLTRLSTAALAEFRTAFICNPTSLHLATATTCAQAGLDLFIEKPLSHTLRGVARLQSLTQKKRLICLIGCNVRFHPCLQRIKSVLDKGTLGKTYSISLEFGYYLPYWRPGTDYRRNYAARKRSGGGIILDDIHEFDLLFWLNNFAPVSQRSIIADTVSQLDIDTEDLAVASYEFRNKVIGSVRCDYLQQHYHRTCRVIGERGNLTWSFDENIVWLETKGRRRQLFQAKSFDFNQTYLDEIRYFFACLTKRQQTFNSIRQARFTLEQVLPRKT